jgi:hypothetical protein
MKISIYFFTAILSLVIISCVPDNKSEEEVDNSKPKTMVYTPEGFMIEKVPDAIPKVPDLPIKKAGIADFVGSFYNEDYPNREWKKLVIKDLGNGKVNVHVGGRESNGVPVCNFKYDGVYKDGHIIVPIQPQGMDGIRITIQRTNKGEMYLNAKGPEEDAYRAMELFCRVYTTISGYYRTVPGKS